MAPTAIDAPPARAAMPPRRARKTRENTATTGISWLPGTTHATTNGSEAPTVKVPAEYNAAWIGRALTFSEIPISSLACAASASRAISCSATCLARTGSRPLCSYIVASSSFSNSTSYSSDFFSSARSAFSVSDCELTDTYSPAAIDIAPATKPAAPARKMPSWAVLAAATPIIRLAVDTIPSFAPSTAARNHPTRCDRYISL